MSNFHIFEKIAFRIIAKVMDEFPAPVYISYQEMWPDEECLNLQLRKDYCFYTMLFLTENKYLIRKSQEYQNGFSLLVPTDKLLAIMNTMPEVLRPKNQTLWSFFRENAKSGLAANIQESVGLLIKTGANLVSF